MSTLASALGPLRSEGRPHGVLPTPPRPPCLSGPHPPSDMSREVSLHRGHSAWGVPGTLSCAFRSPLPRPRGRPPGTSMGQRTWRGHLLTTHPSRPWWVSPTPMSWHILEWTVATWGSECLSCLLPLLRGNPLGGGERTVLSQHGLCAGAGGALSPDPHCRPALLVRAGARVDGDT